MFGRVVAILKSSDPEVIKRYVPRLIAIRDAASGIGWGYYDYLCEALAGAFPRAAEDEVEALSRVLQGPEEQASIQVSGALRSQDYKIARSRRKHTTLVRRNMRPIRPRPRP
jgi:hypothetical protein